MSPCTQNCGTYMHHIRVPSISTVIDTADMQYTTMLKEKIRIYGMLLIFNYLLKYMHFMLVCAHFVLGKYMTHHSCMNIREDLIIIQYFYSSIGASEAEYTENQKVCHSFLKHVLKGTVPPFENSALKHMYVKMFSRCRRSGSYHCPFIFQNVQRK